MDARLASELLVSAYLRQCSTKGISAYVAHKGEAESGVITLKITRQGYVCRLLMQARDSNGRLGWRDVFDDMLIDEKKADEYIRRTVERDRDVWVVEIEDFKDVFILEGDVLS